MAEVFPRRALDALFDSGRGGRPLVSYSFLALCYLVTVPTLFEPELYRVLGGIEPRRHWWQLFTAVFEHGWPGFHGSLHLALNTLLILECGRPCERLLGRIRFLTLCLASMGVAAVVQVLADGVNGSSPVIWAWGPPLFLAWRWARTRGEDITDSRAYGRIQMVLVLMYGVIVVVMTVLPYLSGWRGNPLMSLILGNLYHLAAAATGTVFAWVIAGPIRRRMERLGRAAEDADDATSKGPFS